MVEIPSSYFSIYLLRRYRGEIGSILDDGSSTFFFRLATTTTRVDDSFFAIVSPPIIRHAQFIAPVSFHFADIAIKPIVPQCAIINGDIYGGEIAATLIRKTNFNYFSSPEESWRERS